MSDRRHSPLAAGLALAALPRLISVFGPSRLGPREVEVATATLDDLAFALDRRAVLTPAERAALEALYFLAREQGCQGGAAALPLVHRRGAA